jgi:hypothetical protein
MTTPVRWDIDFKAFRVRVRAAVPDETRKT